MKQFMRERLLQITLGTLPDDSPASLNNEAAREAETASAEEAESRLAAYRRGELTAQDGPTFLRELRRRLMH